MAKVKFKMPDDFLSDISKLGANTDTIVPKVLQTGAEIVERKVRANLKSVVGKDTKYPSRSTGELISSLGISKPLQDKDGNFNVKIGFSEKRNDGKSNAQIANIIEYGKSGQPPKPFLKPAQSASKKECINAMIKKLEQEIKNI